jgi:hypothetical protein
VKVQDVPRGGGVVLSLGWKNLKVSQARSRESKSAILAGAESTLVSSPNPVSHHVGSRSLSLSARLIDDKCVRFVIGQLLRSVT